MRPKIDPEIFEWLGQEIEPPPPVVPRAAKKWRQKLTPAQEKLRVAQQRFILCWGNKGGSKTYGVLSKMVEHCYNNRNALGLILVKVSNMAVKGGAWDKLTTEVLPCWKEGNRDRSGNKLDEGMGLVYTEVKFDANHCPYVWIQNRYGTWCMITVMSCPHAQQLRARIRGVEPSFVFLDEATSCDSAEYFESVAAQLGRRPRVDGVQPFIAATNPEDPDHWVFLKWFVEPYDEATGKKDENYHDIFFPAEENKENLPAGYLEGLVSVYGKNATEAARMIGGEWVAQPSGEALFGDLFNILVHVRPLDETMNPHPKEWLVPSTAYPMILGIDPGAVFNSFVFLQRLPVDGKMKWLTFDEIVLLRQKVKYGVLVPIVMRRIKWWREVAGADIPQVWNSDDSAFNVFRASHGSYDALVIERIYEENRKAIGLEPMRIKPAPKFNGSVEARISIEQAALANDEVIVSSRCHRVRAMYQRLESEKQKANAPFDPKLAMTPRRSDHLHTFDAGSYPKLTMSIQPSLLQPSRSGGPTLYSARAA